MPTGTELPPAVHYHVFKNMFYKHYQKVGYRWDVIRTLLHRRRGFEHIAPPPDSQWSGYTVKVQQSQNTSSQQRNSVIGSQQKARKFPFKFFWHIFLLRSDGFCVTLSIIRFSTRSQCSVSLFRHPFSLSWRRCGKSWDAHTHAERRDWSGEGGCGATGSVRGIRVNVRSLTTVQDKFQLLRVSEGIWKPKPGCRCVNGAVMGQHFVGNVVLKLILYSVSPPSPQSTIFE